MGTAEVTADQPGGLVAQEDVADFAHQVRRLLDEPALRAALSRQAIEKAARWSAPATAARLSALYEHCVAASAEANGIKTESA